MFCMIFGINWWLYFNQFLCSICLVLKCLHAMWFIFFSAIRKKQAKSLLWLPYWFCLFVFANWVAWVICGSWANFNCCCNTNLTGFPINCAILNEFIVLNKVVVAILTFVLYIYYLLCLNFLDRNFVNLPEEMHLCHLSTILSFVRNNIDFHFYSEHSRAKNKRSASIHFFPKKFAALTRSEPCSDFETNRSP